MDYESQIKSNLKNKKTDSTTELAELSVGLTTVGRALGKQAPL